MVLNPYDRERYRDSWNALAPDGKGTIAWAWVQPLYSSFEEIALHNSAPIITIQGRDSCSIIIPVRTHSHLAWSSFSEIALAWKP